MRITAKINKWVHFYYFVQNLSAWHFSTVSQYNQDWETHVGILSPSEKTLLACFAKVHKKYSFGSKTPLFTFFLSGRDPLLQIKNALPPEDAELMTTCFAAFAEKFDIIWDKDQEKLQAWSKRLNAIFRSDPFHIQEIVEVLSLIYGRGDETFQETLVYPVFSGDTYYLNAIAYTDQVSVIFPLSCVSQERERDVLAVLWHEIIHLHFDHVWLIPFLQKHYKENDFQQINEITAAALFPSGILGQTYFSQSGNANIYDGDITQKQAKESLALMAEYVDSKKPLDEKYVNRLVSVLEF